MEQIPLKKRESSPYGRQLAKELTKKLEEYAKRGQLEVFVSAIDDVLQQHIYPVAVEVALTTVATTLFPNWSAGRVGASMINRTVGPLAGATLKGLRGSEKPIEPEMKKWAFVYKHILDCEKTNIYLENLSDQGTKNAIDFLKKFINNSLHGQDTDGNIIRTEPKHMGQLIKRAIGIMQKPNNLRRIDWNEKIEGMEITRNQEKERLYNDYPEIRSSLEMVFNSITQVSEGDEISPLRIIFVGKPGNGKTRLVERIEKMVGLDSIHLTASDMANQRKIFGADSLELGAAEGPISDIGLYGKLPGELLTKEHTNLIIRITDDIKWGQPIHGGLPLQESSTVLDFLDKDIERTKPSLRCFMDSDDKSVAPTMDLGKMVVLGTSNNFVMATTPGQQPTEGQQAVASRIKEVYLPDMSTEKKMAWAEKHVSDNKTTSAEIRKAAQEEYLPFIVNADTYIFGSGGVRKVNDAYEHVVNQLNLNPNKGDGALKGECLKILAPGSGRPLDIEFVDTKIAEGKVKNKTWKLKQAMLLLNDDKKLSQDTKDMALNYLQFIVDTDTDDFNRSDIYAVVNALNVVTEKIKEKERLDAEDASIPVELTDSVIKNAILIALAENHPMKLEAMKLKDILSEKIQEIENELF